MIKIIYNRLEFSWWASSEGNALQLQPCQSICQAEGRQIDEGGVAIIFCLSHEGVVPIGRESYNPIVATCFIGDEHEHYIACLGYLIAKADGKQKGSQTRSTYENHVLQTRK
jgi:hypothetical protein